MRLSAVRSGGVTLTLLLVLGFAVRLSFVFHHPFTNDEGSYLYDASTLLAGRLPAGGVLTKAPVPVGLFLVSVWLTHWSLFAARFVSALLNVLTALPLAMLGSRLFGRHVGWTTGILWLFGAGPIVFAAFGQTEAAAGFFVVSALAFWGRALQVGEQSPASRRWVVRTVASGILLALAFASRKTAVVVILPALALFCFSCLGRRKNRQVLLAAVLGVVLVFIPWLFFAHRLYGAVGVRETLGVGYADIIVGHLREPEFVASWVGPSWWAIAVGARTAGPFALVALVGAGPALLGVLRRRGRAVTPLVPLLWLAALAGLYLAWPTLLPDYLPEFFPALVLLAAVGVQRLAQALSRSGRMGIGVLLLVWNVAILWSVYRTPWIGMFTAEAVEAAVAEVARLVPPDEPIFTAALLVPYRSSHQVLFDVAHPFWYRYAFIPPAVHQTFLPSLEEVENAVRTRVRWALVEHFTDYVYLHAAASGAYLRAHFVPVATIPNATGYRNNPLTLWQRR